MKNKFYLFFYLFLVLFLAGCSERSLELEFNDSVSVNESIDESLKSSNKEIIRETETVKKGSIQSLIDENKSFRCTWKIEKEEVSEDADVENEDEEAAGGVEEGILYVRGNDFFREVKVKENSRESYVKVLGKEGKIFQWSSLFDQGTTMTLNQAINNEIIDLNRSYDWGCEKIQLEDSLFEVPDDVQFIQFEEYSPESTLED